MCRASLTHALLRTSDMPDAYTPRATAAAASAAAAAAASGARQLDQMTVLQNFMDAPSHVPSHQAPVPYGGGGGEQEWGGRAAPGIGGWKGKMVMRMVLVFDKPGGAGSQRLTGRIIIRGAGRRTESPDAVDVGGGGAGGGKGEGEGGGEVGASGEVDVGGVSVSEEEEEVVVNGEFVRVLQDQDVELFEGAVARNSVFEGVTSYDQLFSSSHTTLNRNGDRPSAAGEGAGAGGGCVSARDDSARVIESEEEEAKSRFIVKFEGKEVARYATRPEAEDAQVHAELARLRWGSSLRGGQGMEGAGDGYVDVDAAGADGGERAAGGGRVGEGGVTDGGLEGGGRRESGCGKSG